MDIVTTVLGDIDASRMGHCQPHEHVYILETPALMTNKELRINNLQASKDELRLYKEAGGDTIVDAQPVATGRDANALAEASKVSGVNIIACTGYHIFLFYEKEHWIYTADEKLLAEFFAEELNSGMYLGGRYSFPRYKTNIKAGAVKAMITAEGAVGRVKTLLRAAGRAASISGAPHILHTESGIGALQALEILSGVGVPPERVLVCHADRQSIDYDLNLEIVKAGAYLEYDTITLFHYHDNETEIRLILHMLEHGYEDQLLISTDTTTDRMKSYGGKVGMDYILTEFIPKLKAAGISEHLISKMVRDNPAKALKRI